MSGRRRPRKKAASAPSESDLEVVRRAREALPDLPTADLYRIHDLLERALAKPKLDGGVIAALRRALDRQS